jgi:diguanylate cyclase (GGDEF)-like protein/PAS domain S-box-containing protein
MRILRAYGLALLSVTIALLLTLVITPIRQQFRFLLFILAVFVSATGGFWPGIFATLLSMMVGVLFVFESLHFSEISSPAVLIPLIVFCGVGFVITWITHRLHRSEEEARAEAAVIESSADSIIRAGLDNTILSWNKAAERTYGYTADEAIGRPVSLIVPPDCAEELRRLTERVHHGASVQSHETVCVRKDGARLNVALTLSPVRDRDGKTVAMSTIARDITQRKQAEEALRESIEKLERRTHQLKVLTEMGHLLQASSTPADAYAVAARFAQTLIAATSGSLYVYSAATKDLELVNRWGDQQPAEKEFLVPDDCWGLRMGRAHFVEEPQADLLCRHLADPPPACYLCAPMIAHGETLGLLHLRLSRAQQTLSGATPADPVEFPWLATSIAEHLALAVADMNLREALRAQSIRDPLTGWFNRRYMEETLEREISRAARNRRPLALIMLDVDNFKQFNDSFGHEAGDMALQNLCDRLKSHVRNEDVACRLGGDEFVLVLPDTSAQLAAQRVEELRNAVAHMDVQYQGRLLEPMALSFGIATFPENGRTLKDLLRASDNALFRAKEVGRNEVRPRE